MSRRRFLATQEGSGLAKFLTVGAILVTLVGFSTLSFSFSQDHAQRLACTHNQHAMTESVGAFAADNAGVYPLRLRLVVRYYKEQPDAFGECPIEHVQYSYDRKSGVVSCPNPRHRPS